MGTSPSSYIQVPLGGGGFVYIDGTMLLLTESAVHTRKYLL